MNFAISSDAVDGVDGKEPPPRAHNALGLGSSHDTIRLLISLALGPFNTVDASLTHLG